MSRNGNNYFALGIEVDLLTDDKEINSTLWGFAMILKTEITSQSEYYLFKIFSSSFISAVENWF